MSRQRSANEQAIDKTLKYLFEVKNLCKPIFNVYPTIQAERNGISKSSGSALKTLGIIKHLGKNKYEWLKGEPDRQMALLILEKLRVRQQKTIDSPVLPNMGALIEAVNSLTEKLTLTSNLPKHRTVEPKTPSLFADQESKEAIRLKILCSITSGVYNMEYKETVSEPFSIYSPEHVHHLNNAIIEATEDLMNKFNSK